MFENDPDYKAKRAIVEAGESVKVNGRFVSTVKDLDVAYGALVAQKAVPEASKESVKADADVAVITAERDRLMQENTDLRTFLGNLERNYDVLRREHQDLKEFTQRSAPWPPAVVLSLDAIKQFAEDNPGALNGETPDQYARRELAAFRDGVNEQVTHLLNESTQPETAPEAQPAEGEPEKATSGNASETPPPAETVGESQPEAAEGQGEQSPQPEETSEERQSVNPLPADFPAKQKLEANGITTLEAVPTDRNTLMELPGIGDKAADAILLRLSDK
jgi:hypothetical protein